MSTTELPALWRWALAIFPVLRQRWRKLSSKPAKIYESLGQLCEQTKQFQCVADSLIQLSIALGYDSPQLDPDLNDQIWTALSRARHSPVMFTHRYHHAWWLLQQSIRQAGSLTAQISAWRAWQKKYPSHPANLRPPSILTNLQNYQAPSIGILLPLTGSYAKAGRAAQNGFIAGYLSEGGESLPELHFYDSNTADLGALWESMLADNITVAVGPLIKDKAERFVALTEFSNIPRLTLNYLPNNQQANTMETAPLFQLGIAIEDEATSLAQYVLEQGYEKVAIVHSDDVWAKRAVVAYQSQWPFDVTTASFEDVKGLTEAVGVAMQVAESEVRRREIANILGKQVEFLPRARQDLEAIIAFTSNIESRALVPALRFHFGSHLPVYATSQAARRGSLQELKGFNLSEMPLFAEQNPEFDALIASFDLHENPYVELYALGFDAYRVATWLPVISPQDKVSMPGASGYLWLAPNGNFRRELSLTSVNDQGVRTRN